MYTPNFRIKKAAIHEKTTGYGFNPLEKNGFYSKLTLEVCPYETAFFRRGWEKERKGCAALFVATHAILAQGTFTDFTRACVALLRQLGTP